MKLMMMTMVAGALALPAEAALPCDVYDQIVAGAVMIMQVVPTSVTPPEGGGQGRCTFRGEIVRSFLGPHPVGTAIVTSISCMAPFEPGSDRDIEVGGTMWTDFEALRDAAVVELHISPEGGPLDTGVVFLDAPTDAPARVSACSE
jgi:hypothetical protein